MRDGNTKTRRSKSKSEDVRAEYDFTGGARGKYVDQYRRGTNVVLLDPDVSKAFPDSKSVNDALRELLSVPKRAISKRGLDG